MKVSRLEQLADGIFSIVMTLLVFDIKVPVLSDPKNTIELFEAARLLFPALLTYLLSFSLLFTYWRAHHFFVSVYATNIDQNLTNINAVFFLFVTLIPFSASLLAGYPENQFSVIIFGIHTIILGLCLFWMRRYVFISEHIKNIDVSKEEIHRGTIRIFVPMFFAVFAIMLSFANTGLSMALFTAAVLFNFSHASTRMITKFLKSLQ